MSLQCCKIRIPPTSYPQHRPVLCPMSYVPTHPSFPYKIRSIRINKAKQSSPPPPTPLPRIPPHNPPIRQWIHGAKPTLHIPIPTNLPLPMTLLPARGTMLLNDNHLITTPSPAFLASFFHYNAFGVEGRGVAHDGDRGGRAGGADFYGLWVVERGC